MIKLADQVTSPPTKKGGRAHSGFHCLQKSRAEDVRVPSFAEMGRLAFQLSPKAAFVFHWEIAQLRTKSTPNSVEAGASTDDVVPVRR